MKKNRFKNLLKVFGVFYKESKDGKSFALCFDIKSSSDIGNTCVLLHLMCIESIKLL